MTSFSCRRLLRASVVVGAVGALNLVEPRQLGPWTRTAYRMGTAAVSGLLVAETTTEDRALLGPALDGVLTGGVTLGLMDLSESLDGRINDGLHRLGMNRPRALLAGIGAAGAAALYLFPALAGTAERWTTPEGLLGESEPVDMPDDVRALLGALLEAPADGADLPGAQVLRDQLGIARCLQLGEGDSSSEVQILVEEPERLAVPRNQTWPVTGRFDQAGQHFELELQIDAGMLGMLSVMVRDEEERVEEALDHLDDPRFAMPRPDELTLHRESETA